MKEKVVPADWRASEVVKQAARRMRREMTPAERVLWRAIRGQRVAGMKFRRQHPIVRYIADFCCVGKKLIVEVDGPVHEFSVDCDHQRQSTLEEIGYAFVRVSNDDLMKRLPMVIREIAQKA